jgi:DNA-binding transcriptional regulator YiaG
MTPLQLKKARKRLGFSGETLARVVGVSSDRIIRRWETGDSRIPQAVAIAVRLMLDDAALRERLIKDSERTRANGSGR